MVVGLKSPGLASSLRCATSCQVRAKMRSFSRSRTRGSRYIVEGSVDARARSPSSFMGQHCRAVPFSVAVVGGRVWSHPGMTSVGVEGERIAAVGTADFPATRVLNARGAWILPAFNDAHVHFLHASRALSELDLFGAETQAEIESRVVGYARNTDGEWVLGRGWLYSAFPGGMPTVGLLDTLVPDRPAYLESFDAHTGWANSLALEIAGVSRREVLLEEAMLEVTRHLPARTPEQDLESLRAGMRLAASRGIASVQEAGDGQNQVQLWESLRAGGELLMRVRLAFDMTPSTDVTRYGG